MNPPQALNSYGDKLIQAGDGHGADISTQRQDELDRMSIARAVELAKMGKTVRTLDLGSGRGAQTKRLLAAGATLGVAVDQADFSDQFYASLPAGDRIGVFIPLDLGDSNFPQKITKRAETSVFDIVIFQRTIHYFTHAQAGAILASIRDLMAPHARLYISASGMDSELGDGYGGRSAPLPERFAPLAPSMAAKHGIFPSVCLYSTEELALLCQKAGLRILMAQESEFGNIKIIAEPL